jgi:hypothetical protein
MSSPNPTMTTAVAGMMRSKRHHLKEQYPLRIDFDSVETTLLAPTENGQKTCSKRRVAASITSNGTGLFSTEAPASPFGLRRERTPRVCIANGSPPPPAEDLLVLSSGGEAVRGGAACAAWLI